MESEEISMHDTKKVILLGNTGVGKSTLFKVFAGYPNSKSNATFGLRPSQDTKYYDQHQIAIYLWDTAGMERMRSLTNSYYHDTAAAVLVFDPTNRETLNDLNGFWLDAVRCRECEDQPTQLFLVVTNQDKVEKLKQRSRDGHRDYVTTDDIERFVFETGRRFSGIYYTSYKDKDKIKQMFDDIALKVKSYEYGRNEEGKGETINLEKPPKKNFLHKLLHAVSSKC